MNNICVIGVGYVGLVTGTCFSDLGNHVVALDIIEQRIENLKKAKLPIYEPGLQEVVERSEDISVRDVFGKLRLAEGKYSSGEIDSKWSEAIEADFAEWKRLRNSY